MKIVIVFGFLIFLTIFTLPVFAESVISVKTSANSYKEGETIVISGKVNPIISNTPVTMQIFNQGNLAYIAQITLAADGSYSNTVIAEGPLWSKAGEYTIRVLYGAENNAETKFSFSPKTDRPIATNTFEVNIVDSGTFDVNYSIEGGIVKNMSINKNNFSLIVVIESTNDGSISLEIPREGLDAKKQDKTDEAFIILINGIESSYKETITDSDSRVITINFEQGDSDIEIIGTTIIPEFGIIVMMILVIGIVTMIMITKKNQIIYSRY